MVVGRVACVSWVAMLMAGCSGMPSTYAGVRGGLSSLRDPDHGQAVRSDSFPGPQFSLAVGTRWRDGLRTELEVSYREHTFGDFEIMGATFGGSGDVFGYGLFANAIYEIDIDRRIRPYVGLGAGAMRSGYDIDSFGGPFLDDTDDGFAGQLLLGVSTDLSECLTMSLGYRLMHAEDPILVDTLGRRFEAGYTSHSVEIGVSYTF